MKYYALAVITSAILYSQTYEFAAGCILGGAYCLLIKDWYDNEE